VVLEMLFVATTFNMFLLHTLKSFPSVEKSESTVNFTLGKIKTQVILATAASIAFSSDAYPISTRACTACTVIPCTYNTYLSTFNNLLSCDFLCLCCRSLAASFLRGALASLACFILPSNNGHKLMVFTGLIMKNNMTF
jgi:hypothetical protein